MAENFHKQSTDKMFSLTADSGSDAPSLLALASSDGAQKQSVLDHAIESALRPVAEVTTSGINAIFGTQWNGESFAGSAAGWLGHVAKAAPLFARGGKATYAVAAGIYALGEMKTGSSASELAIDGTLGAVKGVAMKGGMDLLGRGTQRLGLAGKLWAMPVQGVALGEMSTVTETLLTRENYRDSMGDIAFDLQHAKLGLGRTWEAATDWRNVAMAGATFTAGMGMAKGIQQAAPLMAQSKWLSPLGQAFRRDAHLAGNMTAGFSLGTFAGGAGEWRAQSAGEQPLDWGKIVGAALYQGSADAVGAGLGHKVLPAGAPNTVARRQERIGAQKSPEQILVEEIKSWKPLEEMPIEAREAVFRERAFRLHEIRQIKREAQESESRAASEAAARERGEQPEKRYDPAKAGQKEDIEWTAMTDRGLADYIEAMKLTYRDFREGQVIVDVGAALEQNLARDARALGLPATVISVDPNLGLKQDASSVSPDKMLAREAGRRNPEPNTVAAMGEALPFADNSINSVYGLFSVPYYHITPGPIRATLSEFMRVLKDGGVAKTYPVTEEMRPVYEEILQSLGVPRNRYQFISDGAYGGPSPYSDGRPIEPDHLLIIRKGPSDGQN